MSKNVLGNSFSNINLSLISEIVANSNKWLKNIDLTTFYYVAQNINNPLFFINFPTDEK